MPSWSGLYDGQNGTSYALLSSTANKGGDMTMLSRLFARRDYGRAVTKELLLTLVGVAPGALAQDSHPRVKAFATANGVIPPALAQIETFTEINRVTTAADVTRIVNALDQATSPVPYPVDKSGNGGGNKLRS